MGVPDGPRGSGRQYVADVSVGSCRREGGSVAGRRHRSPTLVMAVVAVVAVVLTVAATVAPAMAVEPFRLEQQITDQVGALAGQEAEVQAAVDRLRAEDDVQLWVVYVDSFSGMPAQDWADETAVTSDLGLNDMLLVVATGDRAFAYSVDQQFPLSDTQLADVATTAIEPALAEDDWAGAVIAATEGLSSAVRGGQQASTTDQGGTPTTAAPGGSETSGGGSRWLWALLVVVAVAAVVGYLWSRSRRRADAPAAAGTAGASPGADPYQGLSLDELARRAGQLLVETDDAVTTSQQEVGFAEAQFGAEAAAPFAAAVTEAKADLAKAFALQQKVNDAEPESDDEKRQMLLEICRLTDAASDRLDSESANFDQLRDIERDAPRLVGSLGAGIEAAAERLAQSEATLAGLQQTYAPAAVTSVAGNIGQARDRLEFARQRVAAARPDVESGNNAAAAPDLAAAEAAVAQAGQLLDAIDRLGADLAQAAQRIVAALEETERDLAEARLLGERQPALAGSAATAAAAVAAAREAASPQGGQDPLAALRRLEEADAALEQALVGARDAQQRQERARASLEQALLAARSEIAAAEDFIATRRGGVGGDARTALAEAQRHYQQALSLQGGDAVTALQEAQAADSLAERALQMARADVDRTGTPGPGSAPGSQGGGLGGLGGAMLGGLLINMAGGMLGGGGRGGGFPGGGSFGPPSFGGRGTRGRRGGGGRF